MRLKHVCILWGWGQTTSCGTLRLSQDEGTCIGLDAKWLRNISSLPISDWLYVISKYRLLAFGTRLAFLHVFEYARHISSLLGCQKYACVPA